MYNYKDVDNIFSRVEADIVVTCKAGVWRWTAEPDPDLFPNFYEDPEHRTRARTFYFDIADLLGPQMIEQAKLRTAIAQYLGAT